MLGLLERSDFEQALAEVSAMGSLAFCVLRYGLALKYSRARDSTHKNSLSTEYLDITRGKNKYITRDVIRVSNPFFLQARIDGPVAQASGPDSGSSSGSGSGSGGGSSTSNSGERGSEAVDLGVGRKYRSERSKRHGGRDDDDDEGNDSEDSDNPFAGFGGGGNPFAGMGGGGGGGLQDLLRKVIAQ